MYIFHKNKTIFIFFPEFSNFQIIGPLVSMVFCEGGWVGAWAREGI